MINCHPYGIITVVVAAAEEFLVELPYLNKECMKEAETCPIYIYISMNYSNHGLFNMIRNSNIVVPFNQVESKRRRLPSCLSLCGIPKRLATGG
jgi:transcription antitermination factor NusG